MKDRWIFVIDKYENIQKEAINMLSAVMASYLEYVLPIKLIDKIDDSDIKENNVIVVGKTANNRLLEECQKQGLIDVPKKDESYSIYVGDSVLSSDHQMVSIAGNDEKGVLYGCMDFCNKYCGDIVYRNGDLWKENFFKNPFERKLKEWKTSSCPAIKTRALWTWGHVIYDYRSFFENMAKLRLNEVVIWNDHAPLNAKDVVNYAHSLGIKVVWGFSWGWGSTCIDIIENYNNDALQRLKKNVLETYENEYSDTNCDGIYFQSFTETDDNYLNGKCIAELVTELVNDISNDLLKKHPDLHIQFGLHATSVKNHLEHLKNVDPRIHIVWEDCGAFPYSYWPEDIEKFDETFNLNKKLLKLREKNEKFGAVLKGMLKLDWTDFEHFSDEYILGERTKSFLNERQVHKNKIWKNVQASWIKNAECIRKTIELIAVEGKDCIVEALVEDSMFENKIMFPVALYAELLWTPTIDSKELMETVAKYPCVNFANI